MDLITSLPKTHDGNDAIIVFVDRLSKMVHFQPCVTEVGAEDVGQYFMQCVVKHHGIPRELVTDRDRRFLSRFWEEVCRLLGVKQLLSTAFHPETDGQTERANRVLEELLRHYVSTDQKDWDRLLPVAEFAVNNAWHESVQNTPFFLNYGQHPLTPVTVDTDRRVPAADNFTTGIQEALKRSKQLLEAAQQRQKAYADQHRRELTFAVGTQVLLSTKHLALKNPGTKKLMPKWVGPFEVTRAVGNVAYKLNLPVNMKVHPVFHVSLLKPYRSDGRVQPPPPPIDTEDGLYYEVEKVLEHRDRKYGRTTRREYLIKWEGYGHEHNTWQPESDLSEEAYQEYWSARTTA